MNNGIDIAKCKFAFRLVNIALIVWGIPMALIMSGMIPSGSDLSLFALGVHLIGAAALFSSLGFLAAYNKRS